MTPSDIKEMNKQIKELLDLNLIRASSSPHSSAAFLVRNHAEILRQKARMVIDYRAFNLNTKFDGYYILIKRY